MSAPTLTVPTRDAIALIVWAHADAHPRHLQEAIGPSEIGEDCERRLLYRSLGLPPVNDTSDPWPSIVGIAVHSWLAEAFRADNDRRDMAGSHYRWIVERRVFMTDGISGTCDLYDVDEADVIDHKVLGATSMQYIKRGEISRRYRTQVHLYGYGFERQNVAVRSVSLAAYPRGGMLSGLHMWTERYSRTYAEDAMDRHSRLVAAATILQLDTPGNPLWAMIPALPTPRCGYCPFFRPGAPPDTSGCPGPMP